MKRFLPLILAVCAVLLPQMFLHSCANTTEAPTGGLKDTIPPYIVDIFPLPGTTGVPLSGTKFNFTFNEYVTLKTPANILLSPPQVKAPTVRLRGKTVVVSFEEDLQPNTTYAISFSDAIADNNEGNMFAGYTYVFSTGNTIDSMLVTGTVQDCNTLDAVKGATVLLYKDHSDSAVFLSRPYAAARTDDWGYFAIPFIQDTLYRIYAIKDGNNNNIYDPDSETIGFIDSLIRPVMHAGDTVREMLRYDMLDTLHCLERISEHELNLFREKPSKQLIVNKERTAERSAYITFMAPGAWIDSIWVKGYSNPQLITQFNILQDSLEIWLNSRKAAPDTMHVFVNYRKTDSLGVLKPELEHIKLPLENERRTYSKRSRRSIKHEDTTCVFKLEAKGETVEQEGISLEFDFPVINADFDAIKFTAISPKQAETETHFSVEQDSLNLRRFVLRPRERHLNGYEYVLKVPERTFRNINGHWSDSTEVKYSLPTDESLSTLTLDLSGVGRKYIVELMNEKRSEVLRRYIIDSDSSLSFPYLKKGKYCIRVTEDGNRNSIVDTGSILGHRQPEKVFLLEFDGSRYISIPAGSEISQSADLSALFI